MLSKTYRLGKQDVSLFFKRNFRVVRGDIVLLRASENKKGISRWAFIVSSAVTKSASTRNLVRRRMSAVADVCKDTIIPGIDVVFSLTLRERLPPSYKNLKDDMIQTLTRCGIL